MSQRKNKKVYYHLPGLFEFYELYCAFLPLYRNTENTFMTGVRSVPSMALLQIVSGEADAQDLDLIIQKKS